MSGGLTTCRQLRPSSQREHHKGDGKLYFFDRRIGLKIFISTGMVAIYLFQPFSAQKYLFKNKTTSSAPISHVTILLNCNINIWLTLNNFSNHTPFTSTFRGTLVRHR